MHRVTLAHKTDLVYDKWTLNWVFCQNSWWGRVWLWKRISLKGISLFFAWGLSDAIHTFNLLNLKNMFGGSDQNSESNTFLKL